LTVRLAWGEARVFFYDAQGRRQAVPASWTDVAAPDPFVVLSRGRVPFRPADLLALAALLQGLRAGGEAAGERVR
jgi:hypothetical protein